MSEEVQTCSPPLLCLEPDKLSKRPADQCPPVTLNGDSSPPLLESREGGVFPANGCSHYSDSLSRKLENILKSHEFSDEEDAENISVQSNLDLRLSKLLMYEEEGDSIASSTWSSGGSSTEPASILDPLAAEFLEETGSVQLSPAQPLGVELAAALDSSSHQFSQSDEEDDSCVYNDGAALVTGSWTGCTSDNQEVSLRRKSASSAMYPSDECFSSDSDSDAGEEVTSRRCVQQQLTALADPVGVVRDQKPYKDPLSEEDPVSHEQLNGLHDIPYSVLPGSRDPLDGSRDTSSSEVESVKHAELVKIQQQFQEVLSRQNKMVQQFHLERQQLHLKAVKQSKIIKKLKRARTTDQCKMQNVISCANMRVLSVEEKMVALVGHCAMLKEELVALRHDYQQSPPHQIPSPSSSIDPQTPSPTDKSHKLRKSVSAGMVSKQKVQKLQRFFGESPPLLQMFLKRLGYEQYVSYFERERIGLVELPYITEQQLIELGIPMGPRQRILDEANKL